MSRERNADGTFGRKKLGYRKKTCPRCGRYLYLREYYRSKNNPDGHDFWCKDCRKKDKKEAYERTRKVPGGLRLNDEGRLVEHNGSVVRLYWPPMKVKDFKRMFPFNTNEELAIDFECSARTIVRRARELGLEKDPVWLAGKMEENRRMAQFMNKLPSTPKPDRTNFIEGGKPYRFKPGHPSYRK